MFLQLETISMETGGKVLTQDSDEFQTLEHCWSFCKESKKWPFVNLVTSAFPSTKEQSQMLKELQESHFFDSFTYDAQS